MSLATEDKFVTEAAARLAMRAPEEWKSFLAAFVLYSEQRRDQLVNANREELERAQGRAQNAASLLGILSNAVRDANTIAERKATARLDLSQPARGTANAPARNWS